MSWLYVAVGIVCLIALQMLRTALSFVFPRYIARPVRQPDAARFGGIELIDQRTEALAALGFAGPAWVGSGEETQAVNGIDAHAVYRNKDEHIVAWLGPTIELAQPNQLLTYYTTLLEDGRYAVTQVSDPYFAIVADSMTPAQTIPPSDPATEVAAHREFVRGLGVPPANATPQEDVLRFAGEHMMAIRSRLLERGFIRESAGVARPSFGFALRMIKGLLTRPKPAQTPSLEVPTSRLGYLSETVERTKDRAPSQDVQWLLMLLSGALFVGIGWPLFGLDFTLILLAVIVLHEGGHWAAMKVFGYGNPHITLLPLLGGVTIGHENDPSAAKRAWVALAGPLPGILLGWALLGTMFTSGEQLSFDGLALMAVIVLLFVNYLNVLPIPPLDGHHVVQAILPPKWVGLQIVLIVIGVAAGIYVGAVLDFWPLGLIAALQLLGIPSLWQTTEFVRQFSRTPVPEGVDKATHRTWIFEALEQKLGKPKNAAKRIGLANNILHQLDLQPMAWGQRTLVTGVYGALLVVPLAALLVTALVPWGYDFADESPEIATLYDELDASYEQFAAESKALEVPELAAVLSEGQAVVPPADGAAIEDLRERMGALPDDLEALYLVRDGQIGDLAIGPAADVRPVDPALFVNGDLQYSVYEGQLYFWHEELGDVTLPRSAVQDWWQLGHVDNEGWMTWAFIDPSAAPGEASVFVLGSEEAGAYPSVTDLLRERWAEDRYATAYEETYEQHSAIRAEAVEELTVSELMDEFPEPSLLVRLITSDDLWGPGPATAEELAELSSRIGRPLPDDLAEAWSNANGHSASGLLATDKVVQAGELEWLDAEGAVLIASMAGHDGFSADSLERCWVVGGMEGYGDEGDEPGSVLGSVFWCPEEPGEYQYIDLRTEQTAENYTTVLRRMSALYVW